MVSISVNWVWLDKLDWVHICGHSGSSDFEARVRLLLDEEALWAHILYLVRDCWVLRFGSVYHPNK